MKVNKVNYETQYFGPLAGKVFTTVRFPKDSSKVDDTLPMDLAERILQTNFKRILLTGYEPLFQQPEILQLILLLKEHDLSWTVHTEGLLIPSPDLRDHIQHWYVRPLYRSDKGKPTLQSDSILFYRQAENASFEFHIQGEKDLAGTYQYIQAFDIPPEKVYISAHANTIPEIRNITKRILKFCRRYHYNAAPPLIPSRWTK